MSHVALPSAITLLFAGCAMLNSGGASRESWRGATYDEVVTRWGMPVSSESLADGRLIFVWHTEGIAARSSIWPSLSVSAASGSGLGIGLGIAAGASHDVPVNCARTLVFLEGRVVDQRWRGAADFCNTFRRGP